MIVYKYTSKTSGKCYIGQTCNTMEQRANHGRGYVTCPHFYAAIQKYGWDDFVGEILKEVETQDEANKWEKYYITFYHSSDPEYGYNIHGGGSQAHVSASTAALISASAKERYFSL